VNKAVIYLFVTIGGAIGSYAPVLLFNQDVFSLAGILGGVVGGILGIWAAIKISNSV
jgi:hypothetical protein